MIDLKKGVIFLLLVFAFASFASADVKNLNLTSDGCPSGQVKFLPVSIQIYNDTEVCVVSPAIEKTTGNFWYPGINSSISMVFEQSNKINCISPWYKIKDDGVDNCCFDVQEAGKIINFTGVSQTFGGPSGTGCFAVSEVISNGTVEYTSCTPNQCTGRECGDNGCGGSCGSCSGGQACNSDGICLVQECKNLTTRMSTGDDECSDGDIAVENGTFIEGSAKHECIPVPYGDDYICGGYKCWASAYQNYTGYIFNRVINNGGCTITESLGGGTEPVENMSFKCRLDNGARYVKMEWCRSSCIEECEGKQCGPDGCGRTCGDCSGTNTCNSTGQCVNVPVNNQDTILRLSARTNALGANATFNSYIYNVSYKEIFGSNYPGQNPHACNGNNAVLKLNASSGAVAFAPNATGNYRTICYGDLRCALKSTCIAGEREVVALSAVNNASLALPGESNYPYKICCLSGVERGYYWLNTNNQVTTAANVDSRVKLVARTGLGENVRVNFTIWENDDVNSDDLIRTSLIVNTSADGIAMFNWTITDSDMAKAGVGELSEGNRGEFYFVAEYTGREANDPGRSPLLITSSYGAVCNLIFVDDDGDENVIRYCDDYNNVITGDKQSQCEEDCNEAESNEKDLLEEELESGESIINSKCDWIEEDSECVYAYDISTGGDDDGDDSFVPGTCKQFVDYTSVCSEGYRTASYTYKKEVTINGVKSLKTQLQMPAGQVWDCFEDSVQQIPCPTAMQEVLPFFSVFNLVAAMSIIALVYVAVLFRKEFR